MTAPRRPRSAWLLVGSTPSSSLKVHSAGQILSRFLARARVCLWRARLRAWVSSSVLELALEWGDAPSERAAVTVGLELLPGAEEALRDLEPGLAELVLCGQALRVSGEVADEMCPTELASLGLEVVVGPPAIGAGDAPEALAQEHLGLALVAVGGDPEERRPGGERAPERALAAAQAPAGLVDIDDRR